MRNGGCDLNAICSLDVDKNVKCTCKPGFTNVDEDSGTKCIGNTQFHFLIIHVLFSKSYAESCKVNNGGCGDNALCSIDKSDRVRCNCKTGYTDTDPGPGTVCEGKERLFRFQMNQFLFMVDSCNVNNGGCDKNATCSHSLQSFAVICTCNTGYTNVGNASSVKCQGKERLSTDQYRFMF